ncbi:YcsE-related riboflavin metabolism phosphatase [Mycoplasma phocimorsus]|uniref:HAD family hydrolase n=1 Tax=Mycoplasma phocimorsus TaxID=3045839 RepID=A0AAJ1UWV4_9MOLU|nr:HAD family hydrolase [Mycoplasma phocimorsus]MDJ1645855.1 HAD family hydrolase [Mycoplasma phocimorsus]MDJ1646419.1 HAD family hydrolase [Mycoplasma phocimorsus]MDJ1647022.1 HAD family hydrolase [Mycoplasma phocimorsus]MDJ1647463.1 HAD family hydrolase [Mycoplasma phocimorsus]MDJ1647999.1 HAD family hydrolase [Mycoplasma phocimorsus]
MNYKIKFAAFDIDGTTLPYAKETFSPKIVEAFKKLHEKGIKIILASGREFVTIGHLLKSSIYADYFIGANGAFIYDIKNDKIIHEQPIYYKDFEILFEKLIPHVDSISIMDKDYGHMSKDSVTNTWFLAPHQDKLVELDNSFSKLDRQHLHLITVVTTNLNAYNLAEDIIENNYLNLQIQSIWERGLFIAAKGVTKSSALKRLMIHEKSSLKYLIAFGDSGNDIEMIRDAGIGVAMQDGDEKLKEYSDFIAPKCDEDGVYLQLEKMEII